MMKILAATLAIAMLSGAPEEKGIFTETDFAQLRFLEGRWQGRAPDGSSFYEEYDFPDQVTMRSRRFPDATFRTSTDGSTASLEGGKIVSRWGEFSWTADSVQPGFVSFRPINAPSAFSWRRVDDDSVEVAQRWRDANGIDQSYTVPLERITSAEAR